MSDDRAGFEIGDVVEVLKEEHRFLEANVPKPHISALHVTDLLNQWFAGRVGTIVAQNSNILYEVEFSDGRFPMAGSIPVWKLRRLENL